MTDNIAIRRIELAEHIYIHACDPELEVWCSECETTVVTKVATGTPLLELIEIGTLHTGRYH